MERDIFFKLEDRVFSYRVAGILVRDRKVLLQYDKNDGGYAFGGGHVAFWETHEETLKREFMEEIGADINVGELRWVAEIFFPWADGKPCHQICFYYDVTLNNDLPDGSFAGDEGGTKVTEHWVEIDKLDELTVYPPQAKELLKKGGFAHFVYRELSVEGA